MAQQNFYPTLNDALAAEGLIAHWPLGLNIQYDRTERVCRSGKCIIVYRDERGMYERPVHYATKCADTHPHSYED